MDELGSRIVPKESVHPAIMPSGKAPRMATEGRMGVFAAGVVEVNANMRLERTLIVGEPSVAINPEQGATTGPCIGNEERGQLREV